MLDFKNIQEWLNFFINNPYFIPIIVSLGILFINGKVNRWLKKINDTFNEKIDKLGNDLWDKLKEYINDKIDYIKNDISKIRECYSELLEKSIIKKDITLEKNIINPPFQENSKSIEKEIYAGENTFAGLK
jgi:hypothetical protein